MYDYADYNETLLGNKSIIITRNYDMIKGQFDVSSDAYAKFKSRFAVEYYHTQQDIDSIVEKYSITHLYIIKGGQYDGLVSTKCKNLIHCVFNATQPHGQVYSAVSDDVNRVHNTHVSVVPHMIRIYDTTENLRQELHIPEAAIVFGRYGGAETFDIAIVHDAIKRILAERTDVYFVFMNTNVFYNHPNIIYLDGTADMERKRKFMNTSDALLHARNDGETFGVSCGEFAVCLKPVITYGGSKDRNHINVLGDKAILYNDYNTIYKILNEFTKDKYDMAQNGYLYYTPKNVMKIFHDVFLC